MSGTGGGAIPSRLFTQLDGRSGTGGLRGLLRAPNWCLTRADHGLARKPTLSCQPNLAPVLGPMSGRTWLITFVTSQVLLEAFQLLKDVVERHLHEHACFMEGRSCGARLEILGCAEGMHQGRGFGRGELVKTAPPHEPGGSTSLRTKWTLGGTRLLGKEPKVLMPRGRGNLILRRLGWSSIPGSRDHDSQASRDFVRWRQPASLSTTAGFTPLPMEKG